MGDGAGEGKWERCSLRKTDEEISNRHGFFSEHFRDRVQNESMKLCRVKWADADLHSWCLAPHLSLEDCSLIPKGTAAEGGT